jgi:GAF domain-containing protein
VTEREHLLADLARRSTQLQTAAEVSRAANSILNPDELMRQVANLVRERFELYYAGLFLVDPTGEWTGEAGRWAVLRAGTGEAGRIQLEQGHKLEIGGESMVGWCVANKQARIALDVGEEAVRFENPLLPETRSEMALPLIVRGQVIGAMTVQSTQESAFSDEDVAVLQTMADQVAVAIENARLFEQAQTRAERERLVRTITNRVHQGADAEAIMRITLQELGQILGATQSIMRLGTREQLLSTQEARASTTEGA